MSKLHFYENGSKVADGDGTPSSTGDWDVTISWGSVKKGHTYKVSQGAKPPTDSYNCLAGAVSGDDATFHSGPNILLESAQNIALALPVATLQAALNAVQKEVTIEIAEADFAELKQNGYRLCFAKKVAEGAYNVVWQSYLKFLENNTFSWTPQYQLFGTNTYDDNIKVKATTNTVNIGLNETSLLNEDGHIEAPYSGGSKTAITLLNKYGSIHPGVNQLSTGIDGQQTSTPIYVAPKTMVSGTATLTPKESVLVWFEQDIVTSTIFSEVRSNPVEIDLTFDNSATRKYEGQEWITP